MIIMGDKGIFLKNYFKSSPELEFLMNDFFRAIENSFVEYDEKEIHKKKILLDIISLFWYSIKNGVNNDEFDKYLKSLYDKELNEKDIFKLLMKIFEYADEMGLSVNFSSPIGNRDFLPENYLIIEFYKRIVNSFIEGNINGNFIPAKRRLWLFWASIRTLNFISDKEKEEKDFELLNINNIHKIAEIVLSYAGECGILNKLETKISYTANYRDLK